MFKLKPQSLFITGTDTGVGKTFVAALLTLNWRAHYWKPIQCGLPSDRDWVQKTTELPASHFTPEAHIFKAPLSPHAAAAQEGKQVDMSMLQLPQLNDRPLIVEGAGGVMVPLNEHNYIRDLIVQLQLPVLLVARSTLGTINHTLLTLTALRQASVPILGVVLNGPPNAGNRQAIETYGQTTVLAEIPPQEVVDKSQMLTLFGSL